jgi:hypothetical protein
VAVVRASDADRQATIEQLSRHTGEGRLTLEELEGRVDEAWRATTHRDLQHVLRELPAPPAPPVPRRHQRRVRAAVVWFAIIVLAVLTIGPGSLWWLLPLAWFRFGAFRTHHHHHHHERRRELPRHRDELTIV